jgi:2-methylcitrate dehydratase PrpD
VLAAELARDGFTGPSEVLEGRFGFLNTFCRDADVARLTAGLGTVWRTLTTTLKCYACHSTAHVAVTAALDIKAEYHVRGDDIDSIRVAGSDKLVSHHAITEPADITMAQYSAPFSVALAFYRDPLDPQMFSAQSLADPAIRALCRRVTLERYADGPQDNQLASRVIVKLKDGRQIEKAAEYFPGMPQRPLTRHELREKFSLLMASYSPGHAGRIFDTMLALETVDDIRALELAL